VPREETLDGPEAKGEALTGERMTHLLDSGVLGGTERRQNDIMMRFDATGAAVAAQGFGARLAFFPLPLPPAADARRADPKAFASFAMCCPGLNSGQDTDPEIERQRFRHACRPPIRPTV